MVPHDRLVAPREHLGVLIEPPIQTAFDQSSLHGNPVNPATAGAPRQNSYWLDATVDKIRQSFLEHFRLNGPVIATGHQAEFFHAGVFAKTIAADLLAVSLKGVSVFVCVDSDTPKTDRLAIPIAPNGIADRQYIPIPGLSSALPIESQALQPLSVWRQFFAAAEHIAGGDTLLREYSNAWLANNETSISIRDATVQAQAATELSLGLTAAKPLQISQLAETQAFRAFAARIVTNAADFAVAYNRAKLNYRKHHRVRSPHNPIADLETAGDRTETPFWVLKPGGPRLRLWVEKRAGTALFFADRLQIGEDSIRNLNSFSAAPKPWNFESAGWRIRPTVITLSAFCRIFLSDIFLHGIGGAKYDEITGELLHSWFRVPAAPMVCVTATAHVPLPLAPLPKKPHRSVRESLYNPQLVWQDLPIDLVKQRQSGIQGVINLRQDDRLNRSARRAAHKSLQETTQKLIRSTQPRRDQLAAAWNNYHATLSRQTIARDREYFFALHSRDTMLALVERLRVELAKTG